MAFFSPSPDRHLGSSIKTPVSNPFSIAPLPSAPALHSLQLPSIDIPTWGVSSFQLRSDFSQKFPQEDNTPLSFYTNYLIIPTQSEGIENARRVWYKRGEAAADTM